MDDRLVTAARVDEDAQYEAGLRPRRLDEYIGQDRVRENLQVAIAAARQRNEHLDHVLLHGPPGLGKTTLAHVIANEMGVPIRATSGPAIENLFHAVNVRSALKLGHARGVAMLAAVEAAVPVFEYTPAEIKRAVVGYGRAEKPQVQQMVKLLLGLPSVPSPHDAADALAVAICHVHASAFAAAPLRRDKAARGRATSWRTYKPA